MATLMQISSQPSSAPLPPDLEPDEEWKQALKVNIEAGLRSMVDEAKQKLGDELAKGIVGPEERERLTADHLATLKTIRQLAEEQFRIALERERQERRWASGEQLDRAWSESMMKEQQAILDRIERERKNKTPAPTPASAPSFQPDPPQLLPPPPPPPPPPPVQFQPKPDAPPESSTPTPLPPNRKAERVARTPTQMADPERDSGPYFSHPLSHERDELAASSDEIPSFRSTRKVRAGSITSMGSWKAPSVLDMEKSFLERSKPSPMYDEPESMSRIARTPTDPLDPTRKESIRRKPSINARAIVQEFWKPSITPEEDAQMSRTFTLARRSSTASATSSFRAPSVLSAAFTDPLDALSNNSDRERSSIHSADQEWSSLDRAREKDREREKPGYVYADDRSVHSNNQRLEDRIGFSQLPTTSPNSATYTRTGDSSRVHVPPPSASRPIVNKKSLTLDDTFPPQSSPSSRNWNSVSRSPYETRWEGSSRSPQTPEDVARSWQSSQLRGRRFSSQDMRHHFQQEGNYYGSRHVHTHREDFEEDGSDDGFDNRSWRIRDYNERRIQDIEEGLRKREDAANRREEELARKAEELKREDEARKKRVEEQRREEEIRRLGEEAKQREDDEAERKEAELRRKEEEANRKEREAAMKEEEVRRKEEEANRKEREVAMKEEEARRKEEEVKRKEEGARRKEEEARKKEQEVKKKERDARLKEEEAKRKEKEARSREMETRRKEEEVKRKEQEANSREIVARRKEEEARRKEEEVRMMEEDARRKEFEARRKQEEAERKEDEARRRTEEASLKAEETRRKEEELRRREDELTRREEDLNRREADMRRREDGKLQDGFRKREEEIRRQRAEERKKQEVWETWPPETFRPTPSPQTPNSSGPWPIPDRNERSASTAASPPIDRISTSASGRSIPTSGWSSTSTRPSSTTSTQPSSTPKPTGPATPTPTPKPPTSSTPNPPFSEAEFHRRQAEQAQQREEQFRREQARLAILEHERQAKSGKTMSKEDVTKLFEAHRNQWDKIQTLGSLIWEDFPWPMFKRPKGPDDLTSPAITAYMLSLSHPQDRATKERIKDNIRRWHPDRFNSQLLPKVKESERERVSEGAGSVARILNDLLRMHSQDTF